MGRSTRLASELRRLIKGLERAEGRFLKPHGLTGPQWAVLTSLAETGEMAISQLGAETDITKGTLTGVVTRLERAGLLTLRPSQKDGRSRVAALTEQGGELVERLREPHLRLVRRLFRGLPRHDLRRLTRHLRRRQRRHAE